jgi:tetratricopeptide (TPR) repeat protein
MRQRSTGIRRARLALVLTLVLMPCSFVVAQSDSVQIEVAPAVLFPLAESSDLFDVGIGARLNGSFGLSDSLFLQGGVGYTSVATRAGSSLSLINLAAGPGFRLSITPQLGLETTVGGGGYLALYDGLAVGNPFGSAAAQLTFSFSDAFSVGLGGSYDYYLTSSGGVIQPLLQGATAFLGGRINPASTGSGVRAPRIEIQDPDLERVFPIFFSYYDDNSLGSVEIVNNERGPIKDVRVSMYVEQYMSGPKLSPVVDRIDPGGRTDVDLYALFQNSILDVTEPTSLQAIVRVEYVQGNAQLAKEQGFTLRVQNRNQITWDDDRKVASFVTAGDPTVQRFSRNTVSSVRSVGSTAINERLRLAMGILEALRLHGVEYTIDPDSSYIELSQNESALDYVQFPQQTLDFRAGDCDDLSILYSSLLETVGIETAFITTPGHIFMAFSLGMSQAEAERTFSSTGDFIFHGGAAWVPVETTILQDGFLAAWTTGAKQWREAVQNEVQAFYPVREAWDLYEPTAFASQPLDIELPDSSDVISSYSQRLSQFVQREIAPLVSRLEERIQATDGSPRLVNRLGTVYARYGLYDRALDQFLLAAGGSRPYGPALVNAGNVYFLRQNYAMALQFYERAKTLQPDDPDVLIGLARTHFELEQYLQAEEQYRTAELLDPETAERFSYVVSENSEAGRASSAQIRSIVIWDEE